MVDGTVLLTGASGLLGTWLRLAAPSGQRIVSLVHRSPVAGTPTVTADMRDAEALMAAFREIRPSLVIHAAYANDEASIVAATRHITNAAAAVDAEMLFISTDAVFSGDGAARDENAAPDPVWDYGSWKAQAEAIVSTSATAAIVRLPLIVSLDPNDHVVERIRSSAARGERTVWFDDEIRQPAGAEEISTALWRIAALDPHRREGVWHLPGPESLTRHEIAQRVVRTLGLDEQTIAAEPTPPRSGRPRHLHLNDARARRSVGWSPSGILI